MSEEKKHTFYSAGDIQRYLSGKMNIAEMHAIEKAALDDPLLAEAIEGYELMGQKDWSKELSELKKRLGRSENKMMTPLYSFRKWWRAAAAVIIMVTGIALTYLFNSKESKNERAIAKVTAFDSSIVTKTDSVTAANGNSSADVVVNDIEKKLPANPVEVKPGAESNTLLAEAKKEKNTDSNFIYKPSARPLKSDNKDITAANNAAGDASKKNSGSLSESTNVQSNEVYADKGLSVQNQVNTAASNFINAQVVSTDDKPVAFANINIQKNKSSVYTDEKGNVKIPVTDSNINVVVTSAGYIPKKMNLKNSAVENKIVLQQDTTVGLTALSSAKSKTAAKPSLRKEIENAEEEEDAEPVIGWIEYNNYISNNLVLPGEAKAKNIHGVVEVFVKLKDNGDISQVKVNKPLCPECDAEAVRLVKEGPKFEVKKSKSKKTKVKIRF